MILRALSRALADMLRPRLLGTVALAAGLAGLLFPLLMYGFFILFGEIIPNTINLPFLGETSLAGGRVLIWMVAMLMLLLFLWAPVTAAICGLFSDRIAREIEAVHYPTRPGKDLPLAASLRETLQLVAMLLAVSIFMLVATPALGLLAPLIGMALNGWLLGREFFQMIALRYLPRTQAIALRKSHSVTLTLTGIAVTAMLFVPLMNIAMPVFATAVFTHLVQMALMQDDQSSEYRRA